MTAQLTAQLTAQHPKNTQNDVLQIPLVDIAAAAGSGIINDSFTEVEGYISFPTEFMRYVTHYCVKNRGESMSPTIRDNSYSVVRLLDRAEWQHMPNEHVYLVVNKDSNLYIKRVINRLNKGFITLTSDNEDKNIYPDFNIKENYIINIWHVEWYITSQLQDLNKGYNSRLKRLEDKVEGILAILPQNPPLKDPVRRRS